jgi:adenosylhomocysteine nucleosidase
VRPILILTGIELEARALARQLELPALRLSGIPAYGRGRVRVAAAGLRATLLESRWAALVHGLDRPLVVSAGVCGALAPGLRTGDVVLPHRVMCPRGEFRPVAAWDGVDTSRAGSGDLLITTADVVATREAKAALFAATTAVAADMESSLIVDAATDAGLTAMVVRGVADDAAQDIPRDLLEVITPAGRLRAGRAAALLVNPVALRRALHIRRATQHALRAVAGVLAALAPSA